MTSCWRAVTLIWKTSLTAFNHLYERESGRHVCSHSAGHESHKLTTNTPDHGADLRSVSQKTRKRFRSSLCHHIDAETEKSNHSTWADPTSSLERSVALVGYAMFATVAGASCRC